MLSETNSYEMQNNSFHSAPPTISQNLNIYEDTTRYYEYSRAYLQKITTRFQCFRAFRHVVRKPEIEPAIIDLHALKLAVSCTKSDTKSRTKSRTISGTKSGTKSDTKIEKLCVPYRAL